MWDIQLADILLVTGTVLTLVILEGLLSGDNALVLAVMVRHLPREQQKRALRYGIWGAFGFQTREKVLDVGPIHASRDKEHNVPYGPLAGGLLAVGGVILLVKNNP